MELTCKNCQKKIIIPEGKIPEGKTASLLCPGCRKKISVTAPVKKTTPVSPSFFDSELSDSPFDFIEETGKTALVCETDPQAVTRIREALENLEYRIETASTSASALEKIKYHLFDLILLEEGFGSTLSFLQHMTMETRREIFVAMLSNQLKTFDHMGALRLSVNLIVHRANLDRLETIISKGVTENDMFYRIFKEIQKKIQER